MRLPSGRCPLASDRLQVNPRRCLPALHRAGRRSSQVSRFPVSHPHPGGPRPLRIRTTHPISDSPMVRRFRAKRCPIVRRSRRKPHATQGVGGGGQGRNRTIDTRIFSTTEPAVRREQVEDREGVSPRPTEPSRPTEPIPSRARENLPNRTGGPCRSTACAHRDRTLSEPRAGRDLGSPPLRRRAAFYRFRRARAFECLNEAIEA